MILRKKGWILGLAVGLCALMPWSVQVKAASSRTVLKVASGSDITSKLVSAIKSSDEVVIPDGTYTISSKIRLDSRTKISAQSSQVTLKNTSSDECMFFTYNYKGKSKNSNITFTNLVLDGSGTKDAVFRMYDGKNITFNNVTFKNSKTGSGLRAYNSEFKMVDCIAQGNKLNGVLMNNSTAELQNVVIKSNKSTGLVLTNKAKAVVTSSTVTANRGHGISVAASTLTLKGQKKAYAQITKNYWNGISVSNKGKITMAYVSCDNNGVNGKKNAEGENAHGLGVTGGSTGKVTSCTFVDNGKCGISVFNASAKLTISKSTISGNGGHGIGARKSVTVNATSCVISGNKEHGIMLVDRCGATIKSCDFTSNKKCGIDIGDSAKKITIQGGTANKNGESGIYAYNAKKVTISKVTANNNKQYGIRVRENSNVKISKCKYTGNKKGDTFIRK